MLHGRQRGRNKSLDGTILQNENNDIHSEIKEKNELGEKFEADKATLEAQIDAVEASDLAPREKKAQLMKLREAVEKLKKEYEEQVTEKVEELKEEAESVMEEMQEAADKLKKQEDSLRNIKLEAGSMDGSAAADAAAEKREKFEQMKEEATRELELKMQRLQEQQRNMRAQNLRGQ